MSAFIRSRILNILVQLESHFFSLAGTLLYFALLPWRHMKPRHSASRIPIYCAEPPTSLEVWEVGGVKVKRGVCSIDSNVRAGDLRHF